jgi:hypothetical protein
MKQPDIERPELGELDWSDAGRDASLLRVFEQAINYALGAEGWYARKRRTKRQWGRALRVSAILLGTAAAVLPILSEIYTTGGKPTIAPAWASVALAVAAALVALDHYFGFSSGWMRFIATELRLTRLRHEFEYEWQDIAVRLIHPISDEDLSMALALAKELVLAVDEVVADETEMWIGEFQTTLERVGKSVDRT